MARKTTEETTQVNEDAMFPRLVQSSDVSSTYEHLVQRLQVCTGLADEDLGFICRNLESNKTRKEALDTLRQKILNENILRERILDKQREKAKVLTARRKYFTSEIAQLDLSDCTMRKYRPRDAKNTDLSAEKLNPKSFSYSRKPQRSQTIPGTKCERNERNVNVDAKDQVTLLLDEFKSLKDGRSVSTEVSTNGDKKDEYLGGFLPSLADRTESDELDKTVSNKSQKQNHENVQLSKPSLRKAASWQEESIHLENRIKEFVAKPNPTPPPQSLKLRRVTVHTTESKYFSPRRKDPVRGIERSPFDVINLHTCPNINLYQDRSWIYQDKVNGKCRYIREAPSPVLPIDSVFHEGSRQNDQ